VEQTRRSRNKPIQLQPSDFWQKYQKHALQKGQPLQEMMLGKPDIYKQNTKSRSVFLTLYKKINSKEINDVNVEPESLNLLRKI
jgi:hypothetical protein